MTKDKGQVDTLCKGEKMTDKRMMATLGNDDCKLQSLHSYCTHVELWLVTRSKRSV